MLKPAEVPPPTSQLSLWAFPPSAPEYLVIQRAVITKPPLAKTSANAKAAIANRLPITGRSTTAFSQYIEDVDLQAAYIAHVGRGRRG